MTGVQTCALPIYDGEGPILKKDKGDDNMSQGDDAEKESQEKESTPPISRRETRLT